MPEGQQERCPECGSTRNEMEIARTSTCPDPFHNPPPQPPDGELHIDDDSELMGATREALDEADQYVPASDLQAAHQRIEETEKERDEAKRALMDEGNRHLATRARIDSLTTEIEKLAYSFDMAAQHAEGSTVASAANAWRKAARELRALTPDDSGSEHQERGR